MDVDFAFLCDAAIDSGGKLSALGIGIDTVTLAEVPGQHGNLTVVAQVRYSLAEVGRKDLVISGVDADGHPFIPEIRGQMAFNPPNSGTEAAAKILVNAVAVKFETYGDHAFHITVSDNQVCRIPFTVSPPPEAA